MPTKELVGQCQMAVSKKEKLCRDNTCRGSKQQVSKQQSECRFIGLKTTKPWYFLDFTPEDLIFLQFVFCFCLSDQHGVCRRSGQTGGSLPADRWFRGLPGLQPRGVDGAESLSGGVHVQRCSLTVQTGRPAGELWMDEQMDWWKIGGCLSDWLTGFLAGWLSDLYETVVLLVAGAPVQEGVSCWCGGISSTDRGAHTAEEEGGKVNVMQTVETY